MSLATSNSIVWIYIDLLPLPDKVATMPELHIWWSPDVGEVRGEHADEIIELIDSHLSLGSVTNSHGTFEIVDPYKKSTELACILGQFYWVLPVPVKAPYEYPEHEPQIVSHSVAHSIQ